MPGHRFEIRPEISADHEGVRNVTRAAFGQDTEATLVDALRSRHGNAAISWVATAETDQLVGHVLMTPAWIENADNERVIDGMALAPVSVHPDCQKRGIGAALCKQAIQEARRREVPFIILLGHPDYYPRFGFEPGHHHGIHCPYPDAPKEAFMINILNDQILDEVTGTGRFDPLFEQVS